MTKHKKQSYHWPLALVLTLIGVFLLLVLTVILFGQKTPLEPTGSELTTTSPPATTITVTYPDVTSPYMTDADVDYNAVLSWTPETVSDVYEVDTEARIFSSINVPIFSGIEGEVVDTINETLRAYAERFATITAETKVLADEDYLLATERDMPFEPYEFAADYRSVYLHGSLLSIVFTHTRAMGGANTYPTYDALCFDLKSGQTVTFATLIGTDEESAITYLTDVFTQIISASPNDYHADVLETLPMLIDLTSFYLTEEGVTFYFDAEAISPSVYGVRYLLIPYEKLS